MNITVRRHLAAALAAAIVLAGVTAGALGRADATRQSSERWFNRVATVPVSANAGSASAEIVAASDDGRTLLYTDAGAGLVGFVDITNPSAPVATGTVDVGGSPTSVAVVKGRALVAVDDTPLEADDTFGPHAGRLLVLNVATRVVERTFDLGGQPDSVKVGPDKRYAAIAIENQRDENVADGVMPHIPANGAERDEPGWLTILDLAGAVPAWSLRTVLLEGLPGMRFPEDPEPEFVDVSALNLAALTLQENNHVVLVDLRTGTVVRHWSAGSVAGQQADTSESPPDIVFAGSIDLPREPDAVVWLDGRTLATADEGDYEGGTRSWTVFDAHGVVLARSGPGFELEVVRHGHYPEERSENKGVEPEGAAFGRYDGAGYFFVAAERGNAVGVYASDSRGLRFRQLLPTGVEPEGLLPIVHRGLFVAASEGDGTLSIFRLERGRATYPTIVSVDSQSAGAVPGASSPIAWGALSALAADQTVAGKLYTVPDAAYANSRILTVDARHVPARIVGVTDLTGGSSEDWDLEGIATRPRAAGSGFWLASEGNANAAAPDAVRLNHLLLVTPSGAITREVPLPPIAGATPTSNGFEGVSSVWNRASAREEVYVAIQRSWDGTSFTRIARYLPGTDTWEFVAYPLDVGSNVGLSELTAVGPNEFAVIERDNLGGAAAVVKRISRFSTAGITWTGIGDPADPALVTKTLVDDLLDDLAVPRGQVIEKVEGLAVDVKGATYVNTDNDAEDGESQFFGLGRWRSIAG
jgi:DNA-binding beta-propeller fold protein YncE